MPEVLPDHTLTPAQRRRVSDVAGLALRQPPDDRSDYITAICADDDLVRERALALVAAHGAPVVEAVATPAGGPAATASAETHLASPASPWAEPVTPRRSAAAATRTWGEFTLLEELGRGGFGVVYRAWDTSLRRDVALKLVNVRNLPAGSDATLLREGQLMARVRHQNVVTVFSAQLIGTDVGLAMEYIQGRTLSALLAQHGPMSAHEAAVIGVALCGALAAVHRVGLIHRDIKASNVMREHGGRIVLMDFGAGREFDGGDVRSGLVGTPVYMAPEVLLRQQVTPCSDVYSLGVLLYHLVTNDYPVQGHAIEELCDAHQHGVRRPLADARPDLPEAFVRVVERTLAADPLQRHPSAAALKRDLVAAVPGVSPESTRHSTRRSHVAATTKPRSRPVAKWTWSQAIVGVVAGLGMLAAMMGFVTTQAFNRMFGRTGAFADESPLAVLGLGMRSLLAPFVAIAVAIIVVNTLLFAGRVVARLVPPVHRAATSVRKASEAFAARAHLGDPAVLAPLVCAVTCLSLAAIVWAFSPLLGALMNTVDSGDAAALGLLASWHADTHALYRMAFNLMILCAGAGVVLVLRRARHTATPAPAGPLAAIAAAMVIGLVLLAVPWRTMWIARFPRVQFGGDVCYVIGESGSDQLVTCPARPVPRSRIVRRDDPRMSPVEAVGRPFDDFARVAGQPR